MYRYHFDLRHSSFPLREGPGRFNQNHNANHAGGIYLGPAAMLHFAIN